MSTTRRTFLAQASSAAGLLSLTPVSALSRPSFVITNVSQLYPVEVARIAVPLSTKELAREVKGWSGKVAFGGGRYSMWAERDRPRAAPRHASVAWSEPSATSFESERCMAMQPKTPQEKKRLSYEKDRRNTYGENSKASRKGIPLTKARANRAERHARDHALAIALGLENSEALASVENLVRSTGPRFWRKSPDTPLGEVLRRKASK